MNPVSEQRTTAQIATAGQELARIAVTRAEMPQAIAKKNQNAELKRGRSLRSWWPLNTSTPEANSSPAIDFQLALISAINSFIGGYSLTG